MRRIVLLRASSGSGDPYEKALQEAGFQAESVPVLRFQFVNAQALRDALAESRFEALVLTSPRAAEAIGRVGLPQQWKEGAAWTVGEETARRARLLGLQPEGQQAGSAEALAERIARSMPSGPLLFVCGDRRRDALPTVLNAQGIEVEEVVAYETHLRPPPLAPGPAPFAVGFFSPSGVEAAQHADAFPWRARRVAIGPATADALMAAGHPAHAVATAPEPAAFVRAVAAATAPPSPGA